MKRMALAGALAAAVAGLLIPALASGGHDNTPPQTTITSGPGAKTRDRTPTFGFSANEDDARFLCKIDGGRFFPCAPPHTTYKLGRGRHGFYVKALDPASNVDRTAAARTFKVVKK